MLSIQTSSKPAKCNLLPCQIKYTGPTDATEKHWVVTDGSGEDGSILFLGRPPMSTSLVLISYCLYRAKVGIFPREEVCWEISSGAWRLRGYCRYLSNYKGTYWRFMNRPYTWSYRGEVTARRPEFNTDLWRGIGREYLQGVVYIRRDYNLGSWCYSWWK